MTYEYGSVKCQFTVVDVGGYGGFKAEISDAVVTCVRRITEYARNHSPF